jgi:hypothetical protein
VIVLRGDEARSRPPHLLMAIDEKALARCHMFE